jgi:hypothetical protein
MLGNLKPGSLQLLMGTVAQASGNPMPVPASGPANVGGKYYYNGQEISKDHYGVIQNYQEQGAKSPYWDPWTKDLLGGKLQGTGQYFFDQYSENASAADAFKKVQEAEQAKVQGQYGDVKGQLQEMFAQKGLTRSGLYAEQAAKLAGSEQTDLQRLSDTIRDQYMSHLQKLEEGRLAEKEEDRERKRRRRGRGYGVAAQLIGTGAQAAKLLI